MRSKFERRLAKKLDDMGVRYKYEEFSYEFDEPVKQRKARCLDCDSTNLVRSAWYTPDFFIYGAGGKLVSVIEAKGRFTAADRRKMVAVREFHPELVDKLHMVFMRDNKIHKNSTTTYSMWCEDNGFDYAIDEFKKEWL